MKTITNSRNITEVKNDIIKAAEVINTFVQENNYTIKTGSLENYTGDSLILLDLALMSNNTRKKIVRQANSLMRKVTMKKANLFFHLIHKNSEVDKVVIDYSERELQIKKARARMKEFKAAYEESLSKYKEVKGDFYKG